MRTALRLLAIPALVGACAAKGQEAYSDYVEVSDAAVPEATLPDENGDAGGGFTGDASGSTTVTADAACASAVEEAKTEVLPVDIIWMVDNSVSMAPAVAEVRSGLHTFAGTIAAKNLDYRVIMLSLRNKAESTGTGTSTRYPVCIAPPLAGDDACGNGPRFFHSSIDIRSTQPLEQFLGTLDQTAGYKAGETRGGEPWGHMLRPAASKTIVIVTDDNSRLSAADFETYPGGTNPQSKSLTLPPGILHPSRNGQFDGYVFAALYGWGSTTNPGEPCKYPDTSSPQSAGPTYTTLVTKTAGPRAQICDGAPAWKPFFDQVAQAVIRSAKLSCDLAIPKPANQTIDPAKVNVQVDAASGATTLLPKVANAAACGTTEGWYYDNEAAPTKVLLCPRACDLANAQVGVGKAGKVEVLFGCDSIVK
jgi:hypothetical protein